jgi:hypothetical protein
MSGPPTHKSEQTGNPMLDRIQANVRDLVQFTKTLLARVATLELGGGLPRYAQIPCPDEDFVLGDEARAAVWYFTGTLSAGRTVTIPRPAESNAYSRLAYNATNHNLTLRTEDGTKVVPNSTGLHLIVSRRIGPEAFF